MTKHDCQACPTPACNNILEHDAILCGDCFVYAKPHLYRFLIRMRLAVRRARKPDEQKSLQERYQANLRGICRQVAENRSAEA